MLTGNTRNRLICAFMSFLLLSSCGGGGGESSTTQLSAVASGPFLVSTAVSGTGNISPSSLLVTGGSAATFTFTPDADSYLAEVTGCGGTQAGNSYTTAAVTATCTVQANFALNPPEFTLVASAGLNGSISPSDIFAGRGSVHTFTVTPDPGYEVASVTGCGGSLEDSLYTTALVTGDCSINATFQEQVQSFVLSTSTNGHGTIFPATVAAQVGEDVEFVITPEPGYQVRTVTPDQCTGDLASDTEFVVYSVSADCQIDFHFRAHWNYQTLFIHNYFPEEGSNSVPFSIADTQDMVSIANNNLASLLNYYSNEMVELTPSVLGVFPLPDTKADYTADDDSGITLVDDAFEIASTTVDLNDFDAVFLILPPLDDGSPGAQAYIGPANVTANNGTYNLRLSWLGGQGYFSYASSVMAHEFGHMAGMFHSSAIECHFRTEAFPIDIHDPVFCGLGDTSGYYEYGDLYDVMGANRGVPNLQKKYKAQWLDEGELITITSTDTVVLDAYAATTPGVKGVRVPLDQRLGKEVDYWVEYRVDDIENDNGNVLRTTNNIQIRLGADEVNDYEGNIYTEPSFYYRQGVSDSFLSATGDSFHDVNNGVRMTWQGVFAGTPASAQVLVELSELAFQKNTAGSINTITLFNGSSSPVNVSGVELKGRMPSSYLITGDGCLSQTLPSGSSCNVEVTRTGSVGDPAVLVLANSDPLRPQATISLGK